MKRVSTIYLILFLSFISFSKTILIQGNYKNFEGKEFSLNWQVTQKGEDLNFFLKGKLKAKMVIKNGNVVKIIEVKKFAGKEKMFTISTPEKIKLELKSTFYPFSLTYNLVTGEKIKKEEKVKDSTFKIIKITEQEIK